MMILCFCIERIDALFFCYVVTAIPNVELSVVKTANVTGPVLVGDKIKYEIVVKNSGLSNATDVKVIDVIDTKLVEIDYSETTQGFL